MRLFNVLSNEAGNLSGRELLWPPFEQAAAASPWFGWGVGAGNAIIPPDSELARLIQTWAAHNEYLRMRVEGGRSAAVCWSCCSCCGWCTTRAVCAGPIG